VNIAEELIAPGGPSAPVWTMLGLIISGITAVIVQQIQSKRAALEAKDAAQKAKENTTNVSNGFVGRMDRKLDGIANDVTDIHKALREHLEWHLNQETPKEGK
jgi:hypothetical protein